ncbi:MAG: carbohydrate porin [Elusimicrobia bacterium]|nr:carbohydrate porin [Elusimicrobiota bacterium]MDE2424471.1 carbohydrate porin [Elusimicrobiota bacterium]
MIRFILSTLLGTLLAAMVVTTGHAEDVAVSATPSEQLDKAQVKTTSRSEEERWNAKFQFTYIGQRHPTFHAAYNGPNSLSPGRDTSWSETATGYLGFRPWHGTEVYFNPEAIQANAFSNLTGLGALTNSEQQKGSGPNPAIYVARLFVRQTIGLGGEADAVQSGQNQLAGTVQRRRIVITAGKVSGIDAFDNNAYAHDGRTQFTNWTFLTHGAFDYAADARGYTGGAFAELFYDDWAFRAGRFMGPVESNGTTLDNRIMLHQGDQIELEHAHRLGDRPGKVRLLGFRNKEHMGRFSDALAFAAANGGGAPSVANVRRDNLKYGAGISLEQSLRSDLGLFARAGWNDGRTETYSFTEIEQAVSVGAQLNGNMWSRDSDTVGLAVAQDGLGREHIRYLEAGGTGFFIGDGRLRYRPERVLEAYYNANLFKKAFLMAGAQYIIDPAYNADRGPVTVWTLRFHVEL